VNAGRNYDKAKIQAQANANLTGTPRWLHQWNGTYWISKEPGLGQRERIDPEPKAVDA
jgi:hypothetical protein